MRESDARGVSSAIVAVLFVVRNSKLRQMKASPSPDMTRSDIGSENDTKVDGLLERSVLASECSNVTGSTASKKKGPYRSILWHKVAVRCGANRISRFRTPPPNPRGVDKSSF